jgi:hypothetical protein
MLATQTAKSRAFLPDGHLAAAACDAKFNAEACRWRESYVPKMTGWSWRQIELQHSLLKKSTIRCHLELYMTLIIV